MRNIFAALLIILCLAPLNAFADTDNAIAANDREIAEKVHDKYRPEIQKLKAEIKELRAESARKLASGSPKKEEIVNIVIKINDLHRRQQLLYVDQLFEVLEALPADKRQEYLQPVIERFLK
ncbi:MAG: periplasmic heavy metal sensor [bacterium]|nr:periplasmic heavy metal sensor [bacterium]